MKPKLFPPQIFPFYWLAYKSNILHCFVQSDVQLSPDPEPLDTVDSEVDILSMYNIYEDVVVVPPSPNGTGSYHHFGGDAITVSMDTFCFLLAIQ